MASERRRQSVTHSSAPALAYEWPVETRYYSANLRLRCAARESRHVDALLGALVAVDAHATDVANSKAAENDTELSSDDDDDADVDAQGSGQRRRRRRRELATPFACFGFDSLDALAEHCEALIVVYDSSSSSSSSSHDAPFERVRRHAALIDELGCEIVVVVDCCGDATRARALSDADTDWCRARFVEHIALAPPAATSDERDQDDANGVSRAHRNSRYVSLSASSLATADYGFARVRDVLHAHSWRSASMRKPAARTVARPVEADEAEERSDVVVDDGDDNDDETNERQMAAFEAALGELGDATTTTSESTAASASFEARHARAMRVLAQFAAAGGLNLDDL